MKPNQSERFPIHNPSHMRDVDHDYYLGLDNHFATSPGSNLDKLRNFARYVPRGDISRFLVKNELFQMILNVHGYIIECGVFLGGGMLTWAQLSSIYEPINHIRRVVGFDTFEGFAGLHEKDAGSDPNYAFEKGYAAPVYEDLLESIRLYNLTRPIGHIPRIELVRGNAVETLPRYVKDNPHVVVALLYLDFDVYEPTKVAIDTLLSRMPKGAIIAFDELNNKDWPGETAAVVDTVGLSRLRLRRFPFQPQISYAVIE